MVDIYPSLADLCGVPAPGYLSGVSLAAALKNPRATPRDSALTQMGPGYSVRTSRYRYTRWGPNGSAGAELYDHESDPEELRNLADEPTAADAVKKMSALLDQRIRHAAEPPDGVEQIRS